MGNVMELEPQVISSIKRYRSRKRGHLLVIALPLVIVIVGMIVFIIWTVATRERIVSLNSDPWFYLVPFFALIPLVLYFGFRITIPGARQFRDVTLQTIDFDMLRFQRFRDALDAVSIGAGIQAPPLIVLAMPTANALTFWRGGPVVGITKELTEADLSRSEVEAVMAHEVSHIVNKDVLKSPSLVGGIYDGVWICVLVFIGVFYYSMGMNSTGATLVWTALVEFGLVLIGIPISLYLRMRQYSISELNPGVYHGDILADSIAAKLISNPGSLESAIKKTSELMKEAEVLPTETICFTQLFIGPLAEWRVEDTRHVPEWMELVSPLLENTPIIRLFAFPFTIVRGFRKYLKKRRYGIRREDYKRWDERWATMKIQMKDFLKWEQKLLEERLHNLELIKGGEWPAFDHVRHA